MSPRSGPDTASGTADLAVLTSPSDALRLLREAGIDVRAADPYYVRCKPDGVIVAYRLEGRGVDGDVLSTYGYVRTERPGAVALATRWADLRPIPPPFGPGIRPLPGGSGRVFVFPNDAGLRKLRFLADLRRVRRLLAELDEVGLRGYRVRRRRSVVTPVRYKPERRFVTRARLSLVHDATGERALRDLFLRLFRDGRGERIDRISRLLRAAGGASLLPRPLGTALSGRLFVEEAVPGRELIDAVVDGEVGPGEVANALIRLHASRCDLGRPFSALDVLTRVRAGLDMIGSRDQRLAASIEILFRRLVSMAPTEGPTMPVHGDLHLHQILVGKQGPVMVDLERAGMGDPLLDLGELLAHLMELAEDHPDDGNRIAWFSDELSEAVTRSAGPPRPADLAFFTAAALANRALLRFRGVAEDWPRRAAALLDMASSVASIGSRWRETWWSLGAGGGPFFIRSGSLSRGFEWEVLYPQRTGPWPGFLERPRRATGEGGHAEGSPVDRIYGLYEPSTRAFRVVPSDQDPELPSLREWAARGEIVSYRVGRRATVRLGAPSFGEAAYAKILSARKARRLVARIGMVEAAGRASEDARFPLIPVMVAAYPQDGVLVFRAVRGLSLHELLMRDSPDVPRALDEAAAALAAMHRVDARALGLNPPRPPMSLDDYAGLAGRYFPQLAPTLGEALETVRSAAADLPAGHRLIHGDLHDRNLIPGEAGLTLLDIDLIRPGHPAEDMGNLAGHLILRVLQRGNGTGVGRDLAERLLQAYRESGGLLEDSAVRGVVAGTLLRLACLYLFRRRWQVLAPEVLQEASHWARSPAEILL